MLHFESAHAWDVWLAANHVSSPGVWLMIAKKGSGVPSVDYSQALDVALCFGWIDGQKDSHKSAFWLQRFTPRRPASTVMARPRSAVLQADHVGSGEEVVPASICAAQRGADETDAEGDAS